MSAEVLRKAASLMRERAEAASDGPWLIHQDGYTQTVTGEGEDWIDLVDPRGRIILSHAHLGDDEETEREVSDVHHIASWHPAVALAVADLLDDGAAYVEYVEQMHAEEATRDEGKFFLAVARVYLGSDA